MGSTCTRVFIFLFCLAQYENMHLIKFYTPINCAVHCNVSLALHIAAKCQVEEEISFYGTYLWPGNVETGVTIPINCSYSCGALTGRVATRYCGEKGVWNPTNFDECPTRVTCDLVNVADVSEFNFFNTRSPVCRK